MTTRTRGKHPNDDKNFSKKWHPIFKEAVDDFSFLLTRGYAPNSSLEIVGNRYKLNKRQRMAVSRIGSSQQDIYKRVNQVLPPTKIKNQTVAIDGFNLLILLESALSGAFIFKCRDNTFRDISSVHGSYKRVQKTENAITLVGEILQDLKVKKVNWFLDKPISNSGRLKKMMLEISEVHQFPWEVELVFNPDKTLVESKNIVISSDGWVLDHSEHWFNLGGLILEKHIKSPNILTF